MPLHRGDRARVREKKGIRCRWGDADPPGKDSYGFDHMEPACRRHPRCSPAEGCVFTEWYSTVSEQSRATHPGSAPPGLVSGPPGSQARCARRGHSTVPLFFCIPTCSVFISCHHNLLSSSTRCSPCRETRNGRRPLSGR